MSVHLESDRHSKCSAIVQHCKMFTILVLFRLSECQNCQNCSFRIAIVHHCSPLFTIAECSPLFTIAYFCLAPAAHFCFVPAAILGIVPELQCHLWLTEEQTTLLVFSFRNYPRELNCLRKLPSRRSKIHGRPNHFSTLSQTWLAPCVRDVFRVHLVHSKLAGSYQSPQETWWKLPEPPRQP